MTSFRLNARRPIDPPADDGFEVSYVLDDGAVHRVPLARAWEMPLERSLPVRRFTSRKGQRHLSGLWWSAQPVATRGLSPGWNTITLVQEAVRRAHAPPRLLTAARHDAGAPIICVIDARIVWRASGSVIRRRDSSVR